MSRWIYAAFAATALAFVATGYVYQFEFDSLPEKIATHWDIRGEPDQWTNKQDAWFHFWGVPAMMLGFLGLTFLLPWLSPKSFKIDDFKGVYYYLMALVTILFGFIHALLLMSALRPDINTGKWLVAGVLAFLALLGNNMGQLRRNFWIGIRTPWTLANDTVWLRTHRLGGWMFFFGGLAGAIAIVVGVPLLICLPLIVAVGLVPVVYSLVLYKQLERQGKL